MNWQVFDELVAKRNFWGITLVSILAFFLIIWSVLIGFDVAIGVVVIGMLIYPFSFFSWFNYSAAFDVEHMMWLTIPFYMLLAVFIARLDKWPKRFVRYASIVVLLLLMLGIPGCLFMNYSF